MATVFDRKFSFPLDLLSRGFVITYHAKEKNRCPGCGKSHWYVGRMTAECAFCSTAMPLAETEMLGSGVMRHGHVTKPRRVARGLHAE